MDTNNLHDPYSKAVIGAAIEVHKTLGPGLLESVNESCLTYELGLRHIPCQTQISLPIEYKSSSVAASLKIDIMVGNSLILELKAVDCITDLHRAQLLTYLKLSGKRIGLLINFNAKMLKDGLVRMVH